jgi:hypothetical protein
MKIHLGRHEMYLDATECIWEQFRFRELARSSRNAFRVDDCPQMNFDRPRDAFGDFRS